MKKAFDRTAGFTLIELLVTITVLGILSAIALPSISSTIKNGRLATEVNDLSVDLAFARAEAGRSGRRVTLCISDNGTGCTTGSAWQGGRIIFTDAGTYGTVESGDEILRVNQPTAPNKVIITASGFTISSSSTQNYLQFRPNGAISSETTGSFKICDDRTGNFGRVVEVLATGRTSLKSTTASCP